MYNVYVLLGLKDRNFYVSFTSNLKNRIKDHSEGRNTSTKSRRSLKLIYYEEHRSRLDAQRRERYLKTTKGTVTIKQIIRNSLRELSAN